MAHYYPFNKASRCLCLGALLLWGPMAAAQTPEAVRALFPDQEAVYLKYAKTVKLYLQDGEPLAETRQENEMMVLSEKNASRYSRYSVYHSGFNELLELEAYTKVPNGSKYTKVKVGDQKTSSSSSNSVFYDDVKETSFDFPALTQNAVTYLSYRQLNKNPRLLSQFAYFPGIPVINLSYTVTVPDEITIKYVVKNDPKGILQLTTEKKRNSTVYTWTAQQYSNPDEYGDAPNDLYFAPHVIVHIASYQTKAGTQPYLNSLDDLYKWNVAFTKELNKTEDPTLRRISDSLVAGKKTDTEKARAIYRWVQQNIKYVAFENGLEGFRPRQAADVCNKRYGDCKDMSSIITQMLRMVGIKAYYTWIGTRDIPYDYNDVPLPIVDNHMISAVELDGQWYFFDATNPHARFDMPPYSIQAKEALISLNENEYKVLRVPVMPAEKNWLEDSTYIQFTPEGVKGFETVNYHGYFGDDIYNTLLYRGEKDEEKRYVKSRMGKASNKFILGDYEIKRLNPAENIVNINAHFEIPGYGKKIGNEYYINLNLEKLFENQLIDTAKRKVPKMFQFLYQIKQHHVLTIPEGYRVSYQPPDYTTDNPFFAYAISYKVKGDKIVATQKAILKTLMLYPADFAAWNKYMQEIQAQYRETVSLERK